MLGTNLATRPFYNERAVHFVLGVLAVAGLAVLTYGVLRIVSYSLDNTELTARAAQADLESERLSARLAELQQVVSAEALESVAAAAREADTLLDQRGFSWTNFFSRIETTLPPDVMLTEVRPAIDAGAIEVTMGVTGSGLDAISEFITRLEESRAFAGVLNLVAELTVDGMYSATLTGQYLPDPPLVASGTDAPPPPGDADLDPGTQGHDEALDETDPGVSEEERR